MFENLKYQWNARRFIAYVEYLQTALQSKNQKLIRICAERALKSGRKALKLENILENIIKIKPKVSIQRTLSCVEKIYDMLQKQEITEPEEQDSIRQAVKRQYVSLTSQIGVVGANPKNFIADRMVDMYRIAADRLDLSQEALRMIYVDNETVPGPLKEVMNQYLDGKLSKEETAKKLTELKSKTESYIKDLGADLDKVEKPQMIVHGPMSLEQRLKSDIAADSMKDNGTIDQKKLFENTAEIYLFDKWAGLAKKLNGRQPTANELIEAQIEAYRTTYEANPTIGNFKDKNDFENWLEKMEQGIKEKRDSYLEAALPLYNAFAEKF